MLFVTYGAVVRLYNVASHLHVELPKEKRTTEVLELADAR